MATFDVWVMRFEPGAEPVPALMRVFRIDEARARELAESVPCAVKHGAPGHLADLFAEALREIGAEVAIKPSERGMSDPPPARKRRVAPATARQKRGLKASLPALPAWTDGDANAPKEEARRPSDPEPSLPMPRLVPEPAPEPTPQSAPAPQPSRGPRVRAGKTPALGSVAGLSLPSDDSYPNLESADAMPPPLAIPGEDEPSPQEARLRAEVPLLPPLPPRRASNIDEDDDDLAPPPPRQPAAAVAERPMPTRKPSMATTPPVSVPIYGTSPVPAPAPPERVLPLILTVLSVFLLIIRLMSGNSVFRGTASWWLGVWVDAAALAALAVGVTGLLRLREDGSEGLLRANRMLIGVMVALALAINLLVMLTRPSASKLAGTTEQRIQTLQSVADACKRTAKTAGECDECCEGRHVFTDACECVVPSHCIEGDASEAACDACCSEPHFYSAAQGCVCKGDAALFK